MQSGVMDKQINEFRLSLGGHAGCWCDAFNFCRNFQSQAFFTNDDGR
jgi:hypothetical protein